MTVVDRIEVCPTLIRTFFQKDSHHTVAEFAKEFPSPEAYVYTWKDATLRELSYTIIRTAKLSDVKTLSFMMVIPNMTEGGWQMRNLGTIDLEDMNLIETTTLEGYDFVPGFMLDIAYTTNE